MNLSDPSTRIALAALLHDIGKLAERAGISRYGIALPPARIVIP